MLRHARLLAHLNGFAFLPAVHAVGGAIRDLLFGLEPSDIDLATRARPAELSSLVAARGWKVVPVGEGHGTVKVIHPQFGPVEVTTFRRDLSTDGRRATVTFASTIEEDLSRRDFTINAVAMRPDGGVIDPFGGVGDIRYRRLRFVGDPGTRVREDYLRVLRGFRFARRYDLKIDGPTRTAMLRYAAEVPDRVSIERIVAEFDRAFEDPAAGAYIADLYGAGLLIQRRVVPELAGVDGLRLDPDRHPEGSLLEHITRVIGESPPSHRWHALFHDIGKVASARPSSRGPWHCYPDHEEVGARQVRLIARRLKLDRALSTSLEVVTRHHGIPFRMAALGRFPTDAERRRFQVALGVYLADLWTLHRAHSPTTPAVSRLFEPLPRAELEPALKGRHLVAAGFRHADEPSAPDERNFSAVLARAYEYQLEMGEIDPQALLTEALLPK